MVFCRPYLFLLLTLSALEPSWAGSNPGKVEPLADPDTVVPESHSEAKQHALVSDVAPPQQNLLGTGISESTQTPVAIGDGKVVDVHISVPFAGKKLMAPGAGSGTRPATISASPVPGLESGDSSDARLTADGHLYLGAGRRRSGTGFSYSDSHPKELGRSYGTLRGLPQEQGDTLGTFVGYSSPELCRSKCDSMKSCMSFAACPAVTAHTQNTCYFKNKALMGDEKTGASLITPLDPTHIYTVLKSRYIGCYVDDAARNFAFGPKDYGYKPSTCKAACSKYKYFALQNNGWCSCDSVMRSTAPYIKKPNSECGKIDPECKKCYMGGGWRNAVFEKVSSRPTTPVHDCTTFFVLPPKTRTRCYGHLKHVAKNEGVDLGGKLKGYTRVEDCKVACDKLKGCRSFAACPGDGNTCYFKARTMDAKEPTRDVGRNCVTYFADEKKKDQLCESGGRSAVKAKSKMEHDNDHLYRRKTAAAQSFKEIKDWVIPTPTPSAVPTATPTAGPTATPTAVPTLVPTSSPTATPTGSPTATPTTRHTLHPGQRLNPGQQLTSGGNRLLMQTDSNLVLYCASGRVAWSTHTHGNQAVLVFQGDGNLVVYGAGGNAKWATGPRSGASRLTLQGDGNLVMYSSGHSVLWSSHSFC